MSKVVVGGHIDEISLTDESPFYSPIDFTAGRISYSRPIYRAGKESSWEAIALPFSPQSVKVDGRRLAYDGSDGLSVMEFNMTGDDNNVYFSKVADMQKNVPYLYSVTDDSFVDKTIVFEAEDALVPALPTSWQEPTATLITAQRCRSRATTTTCSTPRERPSHSREAQRL